MPISNHFRQMASYIKSCFSLRVILPWSPFYIKGCLLWMVVIHWRSSSIESYLPFCQGLSQQTYPQSLDKIWFIHISTVGVRRWGETQAYLLKSTKLKVDLLGRALKKTSWRKISREILLLSLSQFKRCVLDKIIS